MTSIVTIHETDSPGTRLIKLERELRIRFPHLSDGEARHLVREQHPTLWALHHQGLQEAPPPALDAGEVLNRRAHQLLSSHAAQNFTQALEMAHQQLPDAARAYQAGEPLLVDQVPEAPQQTYHSSDAGAEVLRLVEAARTADASLTVSAATRRVLAADPVLATAYHTASPLPVGAQPTRRDNLIESALLSVHAQAAELEKLKLAAPAPVKKLHRSPLHRPIRSEAELRPGEILLHKLSGGFYAVPECGA